MRPTDDLTVITFRELATRLGLTPIAVRHAIRRQQWWRVPPPDFDSPYRWRLQTVLDFVAHPPRKPARSPRGARSIARQRRMFDRVGAPLAIAKVRLWLPAFLGIGWA